MPAVELARLSQQIEILVWQFTRPADFLLRLRDLYHLYANRVYKAGHAVSPGSQTPTFHIPAILMRRLETELRPACEQHPNAAFTLVDALWKENIYEYRLLAAILLGMIRLSSPDEVSGRLLAFTETPLDMKVLEAVLSFGGRKMRRELPDAWIMLLETWANASSLAVQAVALKAIEVSSMDENFSNTPPLFRIFSSFLQKGPATLQGELQTTLLALLKVSPNETVYLLRQILPLTNSPTTQRLVRLSLAQVPAEYQNILRQALQTQS